MILTRFLATALIASIAPVWGQITATAVGHQFRQDDWPAIAAAPDGSLWVAWLSFDGDRDDVAIRHYQGRQVGQSAMGARTPAAIAGCRRSAVDAPNRVWVVWSQQVNGNWDLYARRFDPAKQEWGALERLTTDPLPDINPAPGLGRQRPVRAGLAGLPRQEQQYLPEDLRRRELVGRRARHQPRSQRLGAGRGHRQPGHGWVAYDSYKNGNYDVFLAEVRARGAGEEMAVATTPRLKRAPTVAVDTAGSRLGGLGSRASELGQGQRLLIPRRQPGVPLGGVAQAAHRVA